MRELDITVVIPLYNKRDTIIRAIDSVLKQTIKPKELIVVDDGSSDGSSLEVEKLNEAKVKLIVTSNQGVSSARNRGIEYASSEYVAFLDADDFWCENYLEEMDTLIQEFDSVDVYACNSRINYTDGRSTVSPKVFKGGFDRGIISNYFELSCTGLKLFNSSSVVIRKSALVKINGFPEGISSGEDILTWARLATFCEIAYLDKYLSIIDVPVSVMDREGRSHSEVDEVGDELQKLEPFLSPDSTKHFSKYLSHWYEMRTLIFYQKSKRKIALSYWWKMYRLNPISMRGLIILIVLSLPVDLYFGLRSFSAKLRK